MTLIHVGWKTTVKNTFLWNLFYFVTIFRNLKDGKWEKLDLHNEYNELFYIFTISTIYFTSCIESRKWCIAKDKTLQGSVRYSLGRACSLCGTGIQTSLFSSFLVKCEAEFFRGLNLIWLFRTLLSIWWPPVFYQNFGFHCLWLWHATINDS